MTEHCVCCGAEIPEGRMVCVRCDKEADYVNVVRCGSCIHWRPFRDEENGSSGRCVRHFAVNEGMTTDMMWFCPDGEPLEE